MNYFYLFLLTFGLLACGNDSEESTESSTESPEEIQAATDFNTRAKREIEAKLQIPPTEKYDFRIYKSYINSDTIEDAIVTVNRLAFAKAEAAKSGKADKSSEVGYMGNYNYFLYYDGARDLFSVPIPCPSTPGRPLDISFEHIISPTRNDVIVDYRIRNSGWRSYFSVLNESDIALVFQWKMFDNIGTDTPEALKHVIQSGKNAEAKDIFIYESALDNHSKNIPDIYQYVPTMTKQGKLVYQFTYDPRFGKYKLVSEDKNIPIRNRAIYQGK